MDIIERPVRNVIETHYGEPPAPEAIMPNNRYLGGRLTL
jgi:hypothetical protein